MKSNWIRINVCKKGEVDLKWRARLEVVLNKIAQQDAKGSNYTSVSFDLSGHLTYDILFDTDNDQIVAGCGIYRKPDYPRGVYRILNRTFVAPEYRSTKPPYPAYESRLLLPHQLQEFADEIAVAFVSRNGRGAYRFLQYWADELAPSDGWSVSSGFVHVAPDGWNQKCFQYIVQKEFSKNTWNPRLISDQQWMELPP